MTRSSLYLARRAFVDTSAYFALTESHSTYHVDATRILTRLGHEHWRIVTTNFVLAETHSLLLQRLGRVIATSVIPEIRQGTAIVRVSASDERRAWEIITQYDDKDFSFTDATSFAVMERLNIAYAFTFDHHFAQYGVTPLTPSP